MSFSKIKPYLLTTDTVYLPAFTLGKKLGILVSNKGECTERFRSHGALMAQLKKWHVTRGFLQGLFA